MNSRPPPPPQGPPPPYAFVNRYKKKSRSAVLVVAFIGLLWTFFASIGSFRNAALSNLGSFPKLRVVCIVLGVLYLVAAVTQLFGLMAVKTQRVRHARLYAWLSVLFVLLIAGSGLLKVVTHFTLKNDIINVCKNDVEDDTIIQFGFWGPVTVRRPDASEVDGLCQHNWDGNSWRDILAFIITTVIAALFSSCAFVYLRQVLDPSSAANATRAPSYNARHNDYPSHYTPAYDGNYDAYGQEYGTNIDDAFVPPYEAKPGYAPAEGKAGYTGDSKDPFDDHASGSRR